MHNPTSHRSLTLQSVASPNDYALSLLQSRVKVAILLATTVVALQVLSTTLGTQE